MSFPTKKFNSFTKFLKNELHKYIHAQLLFSNIVGFDQEELEILYAESFTKEFSEYVNDEILGKLKFAGKNISYAMNAYSSLHPLCSHLDLLDFVEEIVDQQLENFLDDYDLPEWCDERFESSDQENEPPIQKETPPISHRQITEFHTI